MTVRVSSVDTGWPKTLVYGVGVLDSPSGPSYPPSRLGKVSSVTVEEVSLWRG